MKPGEARERKPPPPSLFLCFFFVEHLPCEYLGVCFVLCSTYTNEALNFSLAAQQRKGREKLKGKGNVKWKMCKPEHGTFRRWLTSLNDRWHFSWLAIVLPPPRPHSVFCYSAFLVYNSLTKRFQYLVIHITKFIYSSPLITPGEQ